MRKNLLSFHACFRIFMLIIVISMTNLYADKTQTYSPPNRGITIKRTDIGKFSDHGFYPIKFSITNNEHIPHSWVFSTETGVIGEVKVRPGETTTNIFYIPGTPRPHYDGSDKIVKAVEQNTGLVDTFYIEKNKDEKALLFSSNVLSTIKEKAKSRSYSSGNWNYATDPNNWPADPKIYSSYGFFIILQSDYDKIDVARKNAIDQWIMSGGHLFIIEIDAKSKKIEEHNIKQIGWGSARSLKGSDKDLVDKIEDLSNNKLKSRFESYPELPKQGDLYKLASASGLLILLLILFSLVVGPGCLYIWAPKNKRHRLFVLIPAISVGFSIILFLMILLFDGTGGHGSRITSVYLDPRLNTAVIKQNQICKTGLLFDSAFTLNENVEFYARFDNDRRPSLYRSGVNFKGDWFMGRSTINQKACEIAPTRARVSIVGMSGKQPVIQSTIPGKLTDFIYQDANGIFWEAKEVGQGQKITLSKAASPDAIKPEPLHFRANGEQGNLAPIKTLSSIIWDQTLIHFHGPVAIDQ